MLGPGAAMDLQAIGPEQARIALRALVTVGTDDGTEPLSDYHRAALAAFQRHITQTDDDVDAIGRVTPAELAAAIPPGPMRSLAVHDLAFMVLADPQGATEHRLALVRSFARALDVEPAILDAATHAVRRQTLRLQLDALRMMAPKEASWTGQIAAMWQAVAPFLGVTDAGVAARYRGLAALPEGTLGRCYHDFLASRGLPFPGEKGGAPEAYFVPHDLVHVLTGYDTDRDGEVQIIGYQAGYTRTENPTEVILLALVQVQLGLVLDPVAPAKTGELDFDLLLRAFRRGTHATIDFTGGAWDFRSDLAEPVDALRERYGVVPAAS